MTRPLRPPEPVTPDAADTDEPADDDDPTEALIDALLDGRTAPPTEAAGDDARARWLMAHLMRWHQREDKPDWWRFFDRVLHCDLDDLRHDTEAIAGLTQVGEAGGRQALLHLDLRIRPHPGAQAPDGHLGLRVNRWASQGPPRYAPDIPREGPRQ